MSILQTIGKWKANGENQVQGLHTCLGVMTIWAAAHFDLNLFWTWIGFLCVTFFLEFVFDPFWEPHPEGTPYTPDWDDFAFYQLGAFLGYITLFL